MHVLSPCLFELLGWINQCDILSAVTAVMTGLVSAVQPVGMTWYKQIANLYLSWSKLALTYQARCKDATLRICGSSGNPHVNIWHETNHSVRFGYGNRKFCSMIDNLQHHTELQGLIDSYKFE